MWSLRSRSKLILAPEMSHWLTGRSDFHLVICLDFWVLLQSKQKGTSMTIGIYSITHKPSNRIYIGSSKNCENRIRDHRTCMNRLNHHNKLIQLELSRGSTVDDFSFAIIACFVGEYDKHRLYELEVRMTLDVPIQFRLNEVLGCSSKSSGIAALICPHCGGKV